MRNVSASFREAVAAQETQESFFALVTISHDSFEDDIRIASIPYEQLPIAGVRGVVSRGQEYVFLPFDLVLPAEDDTGIARARIEISNVDREIVRQARTARMNGSDSLTITIEILITANVDNPEITLPEFRLENVKYNALTLSGDVSIESYELEPFPSGRLTPGDYPGLF